MNDLNITIISVSIAIVLVPYLNPVSLRNLTKHRESFSKEIGRELQKQLKK